MVDITITTTAPQAAAKIDAALNRVNTGRSRLIQTIGRALRDDVKGRIGSRNKGTWAPLSKWGRAKGKARPLTGAGDLVKFRMVGDVGQVYAETPADEYGENWSLTQHHKGFTNKVERGSLVVIPLKRPSALGLPSNRKTFSFIERRAGKTPARQIWPTDKQMEDIGVPIVSRWISGLFKGL